MHEQIQERLALARRLLEELDYTAEKVTAKEFYDYLTGETFSSDTYTLDRVVTNECLMVHELAEISELKRNKIQIDKGTVMKLASSKLLYQAHLKATELELRHALERRDVRWIRARLDHIQTWLEDRNLPAELAPRYRSLFEQMTYYVSLNQSST